MYTLTHTHVRPVYIRCPFLYGYLFGQTPSVNTMNHATALSTRHPTLQIRVYNEGFISDLSHQSPVAHFP